MFSPQIYKHEPSFEKFYEVIMPLFIQFIVYILLPKESTLVAYELIIWHESSIE
jgi:hypothetical protein